MFYIWLHFADHYDSRFCIFQIAGSLAEEGKSLDEVLAATKVAASQLGAHSISHILIPVVPFTCVIWHVLAAPCVLSSPFDGLVWCTAA